MESVKSRQKGPTDFASIYDSLCALQNTVPLAAVKQNLANKALSLDVDRITQSDWQPILKSLKINRGLSIVKMVSHFELECNDDPNSSVREVNAFRRKIPSMHSPQLTLLLSHSLNVMLTSNTKLSELTLHGIPLTPRDVTVLAKGLRKSKSLQVLSLARCNIGDDGLHILCHAIRNVTSLSVVDFTNCSLTGSGLEPLASLIQHQAMLRHSDAWEGSLRYRRPNLDTFTGIRRVTLNSNPLIGDRGGQLLANALRDDLWVKALDLQDCGICEAGANAFIDMLRTNGTIIILDIRKNAMVDAELVEHVMHQVLINCDGHDDPAYEWLPVSEVTAQKKTRHRSSKVRPVRSRSVVARTLNNPKRHLQKAKRLSKSAESLTHFRHRTVCSKMKARTAQNTGAAPVWENTLRRYKKFPVLTGKGLDKKTDVIVDNDLGCEKSAAETCEKSSGTEDVVSETNCQKSMESPLETPTSSPAAATMSQDERGEKLLQRSLLTNAELRTILGEIELLKIHLQQEAFHRKKCETELLQLKIENEVLRQRLESSPTLQADQAKESSSKPMHCHNEGIVDYAKAAAAILSSRAAGQGEHPDALLNNEAVLNNVEESFKEFHSFLDLLKKSGLSDMSNASGHWHEEAFSLDRAHPGSAYSGLYSHNPVRAKPDNYDAMLDPTFSAFNTMHSQADAKVDGFTRLFDQVRLTGDGTSQRWVSPPRAKFNYGSPMLHERELLRRSVGTSNTGQGGRRIRVSWKPSATGATTSLGNASEMTSSTPVKRESRRRHHRRHHHHHHHHRHSAKKTHDVTKGPDKSSATAATQTPPGRQEVMPDSVTPSEDATVSYTTPMDKSVESDLDASSAVYTGSFASVTHEKPTLFVEPVCSNRGGEQNKPKTSSKTFSSK